MAFVCFFGVRVTRALENDVTVFFMTFLPGFLIDNQVIYALEQLIDPNVECLMSEHDFQRFTPLYCAALQGLRWGKPTTGSRVLPFKTARI